MAVGCSRCSVAPGGGQVGELCQPTLPRCQRTRGTVSGWVRPERKASKKSIAGVM
jgi:hypothetical protein